MTRPIESYPKAPHSPFKTQMFGGQDYYVEEKVDGSQFSFGKLNGKLFARSKKVDIDPEHYDGPFNLVVEHIKSISGNLPNGYVFRGEFLQRPKHNVLRYDRVPVGNVIIWDVQTSDGEYLHRGSKEAVCSDCNLEVVPMLFNSCYGIPDIDRLMKVESILGGQIEGLFFKCPYQRNPKDGKYWVKKIVSEKFQEVAKSHKVRKTRTGDPVGDVYETFRSEARWIKAVGRMRDEGRLTGTSRDIGAIIKEVQHDALEECREDAMAMLFKKTQGAFMKKVIEGLPQWYQAHDCDPIDWFKNAEPPSCSQPPLTGPLQPSSSAD